MTTSTRAFAWVSRATRSASKLAFVSLLAASLGGFFIPAIAGAVAPVSPVRVTTQSLPASLNNWFFYNDETDTVDNTLGSFVSGPATPPLGSGSAQISVSGTQRRVLATYQFGGTPLSSITSLRFSTFNPSAGNGEGVGSQRSGYLNMNIDFDGSNTWQKRIAFVPAQNGTVTQDSWKEWDAINSGNALWSYSGATWPGSATPGTTLKSWNQILAEYPSARILPSDPFVGIRVGEPYASGYTENIDKFVFGTSTGTTVFDFDNPDLTPPVIAAHPTVTMAATALGSAVVSYTAPVATDNIDGTDPVSCLPASGSSFSLGNTTVTCNAQDAAGNAATPTTFTVTVTPAAVSASQSTVTASTPITTDGGTSNIIITAKDAFGNPIPGILPTNVVVSVAPLSALDTLTQPVLSTNASGQTTATFQSEVAGNKTVSVTINGTPITAQPSVRFNAGAPTTATIAANPGATVEASLSGVTVTLTITVTDGHGNLVVDNTPVALLSDIGTVGGSGNTVNGVVTRTISYNNKGDAHLSFSGLSAAGTTTIHFVDTTKPVITLNGASTVTTEYLGTYTDLGATATDNIDGNRTSSIVVGNPVVTNVLQFIPAHAGQVVTTYTVTYDVQDTSGNAATQVTRTVNVIDTTAPVISSITSDATAVGALKIGDAIHFTVTPAHSEPGAAVSGSYNGHALTWTTSDAGVTYTAAYTVASGDTDQVAPLQISGVTMTDEAGNTSAAASGTDVAKTIDAHVPTLASISIKSNNAHTNLAKAGDVVTLSFTGSEGLQTPTVTIDGNTAAVAGGPTAWTATYAMASGDPQGPVTFSIAFNDLAGNAGTAVTATSDSSTVTFDSVAPAAPTVSVTTPINIANQASVAITVNGEANAAVAYTLKDTGAGVVSGTGMTDGTGAFSASVNATPLADGTITLSATLTDTAGNTGIAGTNTATKDTVAPVISSAAVSPSTGSVGVGGSVTATLTTSPSQADLAVDSGCTINGVDVTGSFHNNEDGTYTLVYPVAAGNTERNGDLPVSCTFHETAGNTVTVSAFDANTLVIDVTPPPAPTIVSPANNALVQSSALTKIDWTDVTDTSMPVTYRYEVSTSGATNPDGSFASAVYSSGVLTASEIPTPGTPEGQYYFHVRSVDAAGNIGAWGAVTHVTVDNTAPILTAPADQTIEAMAATTTLSASTTPALVLATATDNFDPAPVVTYSPNPVSFGLGTHTVTWTATDAAGNSSQVTSNVIIKDTTAPAITAQADITAEATGPSGATVTYTTPTALDLVDGSVAVACAPVSGSTFAIGSTPVNCSASDLSGNTATSTFNVIVKDTTAPVVTIVPPSQTLEATSPAGAVATFTASSTDIVDGTDPVVCVPASGSTFALGTDTVTCTATDAHGNTGTSTSQIIVQDTTPPAITAPIDQTFVANGNPSNPVLIPATATDIADPAPVITYAPMTFSVGTTTVTWTATDASHNSSTATSTVVIVPAPIAKVTVTASPTTLTTAATSTLTVYGRDQYDNITTNQSGTVALISADNGGALDNTIVTLTNGVATANLTKSAPGVVHVTVSSGALVPNAATVTFTQADTTGPSVTGFLPALSATGVSVSAPISVDFSKALDLSTVTSANIQLWDATSSPAVPVSATLSVTLLSGGAERVNIAPAAPLDYSTNYYITVGTGVKDTVGNALVSAGSLDAANAGFTTAANTADVTPPTIISTDPANGTTTAAVTVSPSITFSEPLKSVTVSPSSVALYDASNTLVPSTISLDNGGTLIVIKPTSPLANSTTYHFTITSGATGVTDQAGNPLAADATFTFTTANPPADVTAPVITNIQAATVGATTTTITWTTDEPSTSQVEYGQTSGYGLMTPINSALVTSHSVTLTGLAGSTLYHFRVSSADASSNTGTSGDNTFTTNVDDSTAVLSVTGIDAVQSFATPDGTFANGFRWIFHVTVPTSETSFAMKFADFVSGSNTIPAAGNIRFYSAQSSNATGTSTALTISAAGAYATPAMNLVTDLTPGVAGRQIDVVVEARVPTTTPAGSYSTSYGIQSLASGI